MEIGSSDFFAKHLKRLYFTTKDTPNYGKAYYEAFCYRRTEFYKSTSRKRLMFSFSNISQK